jgi:hypothetical protein
MNALAVALVVCIRLHDAFGVSETDRREAMRVAALILEQVGVEVDWAGCDRVGSMPPDPRCATPPAGDVVVRLIHSPHDRFDGALSFGYALIDRSTRRGTLATVFPDRVERLAATAGTEAAELLGRAVAHEVGHILLGRGTHSPTGLMREHWRSVEVRRRWSADWAFSAEDEGEIRSRMGGPSRAQLRAARPLLDQRALEALHGDAERERAPAEQVGDVPEGAAGDRAGGARTQQFDAVEQREDLQQVLE